MSTLHLTRKTAGQGDSSFLQRLQVPILIVLVALMLAPATAHTAHADNQTDSSTGDSIQDVGAAYGTGIIFFVVGFYTLTAVLTLLALRRYFQEEHEQDG